MVRKYTIPTQCPNNSAVMCDNNAKCDKCGWDPNVAKNRLKEAVEKLKKGGRRNG